MQKIPTVFVRDHGHGKYVTDTPHPDGRMAKIKARDFQ
jgi:hypothetical protein